MACLGALPSKSCLPGREIFFPRTMGGVFFFEPWCLAVRVSETNHNICARIDHAVAVNLAHYRQLRLFLLFCKTVHRIQENDSGSADHSEPVSHIPRA